MAESTASQNPKKGAALTRQTLKIFWQHTRVYWPLLLLCGAGMVAAIGADMVSPLVFKRFIDLLAIDPIHRTARGNLSSIYHTVVLIGLVMVLSWTGWRSCSMAVMKFESRVMKDLTDHCFAYLQNHSYKFFTDNFQGSLVKRVNRFAAGFEVIADQIAMDAGQTAIRVVCVIGILFWRNAMLGWVFLAWTIVFVCFNVFFAKWKLKFDLARAELDTKVTGRLSDTIGNSINLKLFAGIERETSHFEELTDEHCGARFTSWKLGWYSDGLQGLSIRALEIVVFLMAIRYWMQGILTVGDFIMLRSYLSQLTEEVRGLGGYIRRIYEAMADANEMTEILLTPHEIKDAERAHALVAKKGVVEFRNVSFAYTSDAGLVLQDFNLKTKPGERVGIVGPSGGGKSTILKLLVRLHDVNDGTILIDHQNIAAVTQNSLHQKVAFVPQEPVLFHRSLMENIRYSKPEATDEEVIRAAKLAHCHEFISGFPQGYETLVGERGIKLSGGQRQRVAIARAILMDAPILVLDEATNALDSESEMYVQDSLAKLVLGRTVIAVAHRLSTIRKMDRIVVVKDGQIIEEGNHDLLLKLKNGLYQKLWNLQSSDFIQDDVEPTGGYVQ
ncbi:MAG: ABC transporter ATP-binding protein [Patescibacteria group bacterium]|nr:ABC transporter ATP-binding protein [Patescibacteria group bacterium]